MKKIIFIWAFLGLLISGRVYAACEEGEEFKGAQNGEIYCRSRIYMDWEKIPAWCQQNGLHFVSLEEACLHTYESPVGISDCPNMKVSEDIHGNRLDGSYMWTATRHPIKSSYAYGVRSNTGLISYGDYTHQPASGSALCK